MTVVWLQGRQGPLLQLVYIPYVSIKERTFIDLTVTSSSSPMYPAPSTMKAAKPWILAILGAGLLIIATRYLLMQAAPEPSSTSAGTTPTLWKQLVIPSSGNRAYCKWVFSRYECRCCSQPLTHTLIATQLAHMNCHGSSAFRSRNIISAAS